jgi:hypothetical protein
MTYHPLNSELAHLRITRMHQEAAQRRRAATAKGRSALRYPNRDAARRRT